MCITKIYKQCVEESYLQSHIDAGMNARQLILDASVFSLIEFDHSLLGFSMVVCYFFKILL